VICEIEEQEGGVLYVRTWSTTRELLAVVVCPKDAQGVAAVVQALASVVNSCPCQAAPIGRARRAAADGNVIDFAAYHSTREQIPPPRRQP
jgi:hypothetical protein